jgi:hypothetical protein
LVRKDDIGGMNEVNLELEIDHIINVPRSATSQLHPQLRERIRCTKQ